MKNMAKTVIRKTARSGQLLQQQMVCDVCPNPEERADKPIRQANDIYQ